MARHSPYILVEFRTLYDHLPFGICAIYFDLKVIEKPT